MTRSNVVVSFAIAGFVLASCVFGISAYANRPAQPLSRQSYEEIQDVGLLLCPPAIGMMAADNAPPAFLLVAMFLLASVNAGLYALFGLGLYSLVHGSTAQG
jgi:hypothetical protein